MLIDLTGPQKTALKAAAKRQYVYHDDPASYDWAELGELGLLEFRKVLHGCIFGN